MSRLIGRLIGRLTHPTMRRPCGASLALLAAAALSACSSMAPPYQRPAAPVAAAFPGADASAPVGTNAGNAAATPAADIAWQQFFTDARLKQLIALALQNNRDLRVAVLNIESARALVTVRNADIFPTVGVGISGARTPTANGNNSTVYSAGVQITAYELDLFGRIRSATDAAAAQLLGSEEARKAVQIGLVAGVANTYLALQADDALLRVTAQTLATREDSRRLTQLRFDNGASSQLDLRLSESLLEGARVARAQQLRQRAQDLNALVLLLGQPLPPQAELPPAPAVSAGLTPPAVSAGLSAPAVTAGLSSQAAPAERGLPASADLASLPDLPVGLPSEVLARRPDVRQAEQQLIAANANIGAARAAFFPRISLTGSVGSVSSELSGLFKSGSFGWSLAPTLLQPIFDAGRNRANLQIAQVNRDVAVAQYERAIQAAFREVADALAGRDTLAEQRRAQQAQVAAEQDRFRLADLRQRNGASSTLEVLDAQRSLFTAQQALVQVQALYLQNLVTLYRVLGGGWTEDGAAATASGAAAPLR